MIPFVGIEILGSMYSGWTGELIKKVNNSIVELFGSPAHIQIMDCGVFEDSEPCIRFSLSFFDGYEHGFEHTYTDQEIASCNKLMKMLTGEIGEKFEIRFYNDGSEDFKTPARICGCHRKFVQ